MVGKTNQLAWLLFFLGVSVAFVTRADLLTLGFLRLAAFGVTVILIRVLTLKHPVLASALLLPAVALWASYVMFWGRPGDTMRMAAVVALTFAIPLIGIGRKGLIAAILHAHPASALAAAILAVEFEPMSDVTVITGGKSVAVAAAFLTIPLLSAACSKLHGCWRDAAAIVEPVLIVLVSWIFIQSHVVLPVLRLALLQEHMMNAAFPATVAATLLGITRCLIDRRKVTEASADALA